MIIRVRKNQNYSVISNVHLLNDRFEIKAGSNPIVRKAFRKARFDAETRDYNNLTINFRFYDYLADQTGEGCLMQQKILKSKNERGGEDGRVSRRIET